MRTLFLALRATLYASVFVGGFAWLALQIGGLDFELGVALPVWTPYIGAPLILVGAVLAAACVVVFVARGRGTPAPFDAPRVFVATGPYRYVRNPMYIGGVMMLAGLGLLIASLSMVVFALVIAGVLHLFVILYEEPTLERQFGESYIEYRRSTRRWLPGRPAIA